MSDDWGHTVLGVQQGAAAMLLAHPNVTSIDLSRWAIASIDGDISPVVVRDLSGRR